MRKLLINEVDYGTTVSRINRRPVKCHVNEGGNSRLACFDSTTGPILPLKTKVSYGQGGL